MVRFLAAYHGAAGVVEEKILLTPVGHGVGAILGAQVLRDAAKQGLGVVAVHGDGVLRNLLQPRRDEDEACGDVRVEGVEDGEEEGEGQKCGGREVHLFGVLSLSHTTHTVTGALCYLTGRYLTLPWYPWLLTQSRLPAGRPHT